MRIVHAFALMSTETEVGHLGDAVLDENVARRQVTVHEALVREMHHAVADVQRDLQRRLLVPHVVPSVLSKEHSVVVQVKRCYKALSPQHLALVAYKVQEIAIAQLEH